MDSSEPPIQQPPAAEPPPVPPHMPPPPVVPPPVAPPYRPQPQPQPQQTRKSGSGWMWVALILFLALGVSVLALIGLSASKLALSGAHVRSSGRGWSDLRETVVRESEYSDKIAEISLEGVISGQYIQAIDRTLVELVRDQLEKAADENVRAVILKVDSPGGEVLASDEIYLLIEQFQKDYDIPVVASMGSLAASGGYYVSAPCRWIVANELTMTGSIGVIFHSYNYRALMDKVGVKPDITKSGKLKDMMSGEKTPEEELPEERRIMQAMIDESFAKFKGIVREGRRRAADKNKEEKVEGGRELSANWQDYADGRILSGSEALKIGLVDELGNFDVAFSRALKLADIEGATLVAYQPPFRFRGLFSLLGQAESKSLKIDLGLPMQSDLPQGRLYFMSPIHMR